jgi:hypothetical protein
MFVSAARPLGEYPTWVSHSMFYNRVAYALVFLVIFEQLGISRFEAADNPIANQPQDKMQFWRGLSTGAALVCALLMKFWFVLPGVALLATGLILFGVHRRHLIGMLAGGLAAFGFAITCLHLQPMAFLHEALTLSQQRGAITGEALSTLVNKLGEFLFIMAAGLAVAIGHADLLMVERPNYVEGNTTSTILCALSCPAHQRVRLCGQQPILDVIST